MWRNSTNSADSVMILTATLTCAKSGRLAVRVCGCPSIAREFAATRAEHAGKSGRRLNPIRTGILVDMIRSLLLLVCLWGGSVHAADPAAAARGKKALEETAFIPGFWPAASYDLAWKTWGVAEKPKDYDAAFRDRYGL